MAKRSKPKATKVTTKPKPKPKPSKGNTTTTTNGIGKDLANAINSAVKDPYKPGETEPSGGGSPAYTAPASYSSQYQGQIDAALNNVTNFKYDPLQDASYKALAKVYTANGDRAAKSTMADASMLNGGYGTSHAVSAAQQMRNQYNSELASHIPELENAAFNRNVASLSALRDADDTAYGRYRDTVSDAQWQAQFDYSKYNDDRYYNLDVNKFNQQVKNDDRDFGLKKNYYTKIDLPTSKVNNANTKANTAQTKANTAQTKLQTKLLKKGSSSRRSSGGGGRSSGGGYSYSGGYVGGSSNSYVQQTIKGNSKGGTVHGGGSKTIGGKKTGTTSKKTQTAKKNYKKPLGWRGGGGQ